MKHEKLCDALSQISDAHIAEAAKPRKRRSPWLGAIAAVTAIALLGFGLWRFWPDQGSHLAQVQKPADGKPPANITSGAHLSYLAAVPVYPAVVHYPMVETVYSDWEDWHNCQQTLHDQPSGYADSLESYFTKLVPTLLTNSDGQNAVCSPVNIYMALAMLAETTGGNSREQILTLLGVEDIEALREQAKNVWLAHYNDDGVSTSILGNSLWLDEACIYNEETAQLLAEKYYASVFRGDLGSAEMDKALQSWLSEQTGGLLDETIQDVSFSQETVLGLASTVFYQVPWVAWFLEKNNTQGIFHSTAGDREMTFMRATRSGDPYYWGEDFGAVSLSLEDGSRMWLILPDEGMTPEDLLENGNAMEFILADAYEYPNQKHVNIHLSVPKFDVDSDMQLKEQLKTLGVTDVFDAFKADFSPIIALDDGGYVDSVQHAARVSIDEEGVSAAAFTVIQRCGAAMPPEEEIDFTLDRPFLFVIESNDGLPLFAGVVNQP